jgi:hypothetical protein
MQLSPEHYVVIDYKTGKKFGNEIKHKEQLNLYALAVAIRNPDVQELTTENWYLDQKDGENLTSTDCTRQQAMMKYLKYFDRQAQEMTTATKFPTKANKFSCQWCPYIARVVSFYCLTFPSVFRSFRNDICSRMTMKTFKKMRLKSARTEFTCLTTEYHMTLHFLGGWQSKEESL